MSNKKKAQHRIEYLALKGAMFFIYLFRRSFAQKIGKVVAVFFYYFVPIRKKHVIEMLSLSFPEKSRKEIMRITKSTYKNFIKTVIDIMFFPKMTDEQIKKMMFIDKAEIFERIHNQNKGAILMSAHFGNWELTALSFSKRYPMSVMVAKQSNELIDDMINSIRTKQGFSAISRDNAPQAFKSVMKALKNNHFVAILCDQDAGKQGVFIPFFGRLASFPKGAALFALRAKCPITTAFGVQQKDGSMDMKVGEISLPDTGSQEKDVEIIMTQYAKLLEDAIREHPEQWFWFHRKWKTRP